ncbi:caspase-3 isoform X1 [Lingula anatina]|uniref:Caspase-3 isoform X1 n=2 Tax=Lingula anatina TaxID=7574 RepID=A0A1S3JXZ9_LINAN|nr:caspase-3 isoform X1 [Lingula anatina]|eukprot:XP_013414929.1 caspase-3 isoform X1 [Lingula anatina]
MESAEKPATAMNTVDTSGGPFGVPAGEPKVEVSEPTRRALEGNLEYNFKHVRRGMAIIVNNRNFEEKTEQGERIGTDVDAGALANLFMDLGFEVTRYDNLSTMEMMSVMRQAAQEDHSDADCFACAFLSHGIEGRIYGTNGLISIDLLLSFFKGDKCLSLAGKPKLFFIQACRGKKNDEGVDIPLDETDSATEPKVRRIPTEADYMVAYSVAPGYYSWRNSVDGSWFVQGLVQVLKEFHQEMELLQMMTLVNKVVAEEFASDTGYEYNSGMKQIPTIVSRLTKFVYFRPKYLDYS